jgi:hypothetical protein
MKYDCLSLLGVLIFMKSNYETTMTARNIGLMEHYKTILGGVGIRILPALFLSDELTFKKWGTKTIKNKNENRKT